MIILDSPFEYLAVLNRSLNFKDVMANKGLYNK